MNKLGAFPRFILIFILAGIGYIYFPSQNVNSENPVEIMIFLILVALVGTVFGYVLDMISARNS